MKAFYRSLKPFLNHGDLPRPSDWSAIFGNGHPIELEIGFGNGEYLARLGQMSPQINFIGFEQYCERIQRTLRKLNHSDVHNVRVMRLDVRTGLERYIPPRTIQSMYCLYPPPWPKKSDFKHRLLTGNFLDLANSRLVDGGTLKIVTDYHPYALWIREQIPHGFRFEFKNIPASYDTKFERKWVGEGQSRFYEILLTKTEHTPIGLKEDIKVQTYVIDNFNPDRFSLEPYSKEGIAVTFKEILYDAKKKIAVVHVIVAEDHVVQNIRIGISGIDRGWRIHLAEGTLLMPTVGVAKAIELIYQAALKTVAEVC
jgi:tRNA (guanine-N7-)-methyltransferase